jgi:hypothetical protein
MLKYPVFDRVPTLAMFSRMIDVKETNIAGR